MARPKVPLISRRNALEAALRVIDTEGLDALSIRRLGEELNVNGASLYHHFENKDDILVGAAQLALQDVKTPKSKSDDWRVWLARNAQRTRDALLAHPELIPVVLRRQQLGIGVDQLDQTAERLEQEGVNVGAVLPLIEALETFAVGSALHDAIGLADAQITGKANGHPALARANAARALSSQQIFETVCESIIETIEAQASKRRLRRA